MYKCHKLFTFEYFKHSSDSAINIDRLRKTTPGGPFKHSPNPQSCTCENYFDFTNRNVERNCHGFFSLIVIAAVLLKQTIPAKKRIYTARVYTRYRQTTVGIEKFHGNHARLEHNIIVIIILPCVKHRYMCIHINTPIAYRVYVYDRISSPTTPDSAVPGALSVDPFAPLTSTRRICWFFAEPTIKVTWEYTTSIIGDVNKKL